jgi:quercetin dioxygenase-like cupin family protein
MTAKLQVSTVSEMHPLTPFLRCELLPGQNPDEMAHEAPLFDFASTHHNMGARLITIPPNRAFARHTHPNAYHFIYILEGTGIIEYDGAVHELKPQQCCLVLRGVPHKLGAGKEGLQAIVVNTPTYENGDANHVHYLEEELLESYEEPMPTVSPPDIVAVAKAPAIASSVQA